MTIDFYRFLLAVFLFLAPAAASAQEAQAILDRTAQVYRDLGEYRMDATISVVMEAGENRQAMDLDLRLAARRPSGMRIEVTGPNVDIRIISSGDSTWTYMPGANQYVSTAGGLDEGSLAASVPDLLAEYATVAERVGRAELLRQEAIDLGGESRPAYVLDVTYAPKDPADSLSITRKTLWIDSARGIVLRDSTHARIENTPYGVPMVVDEVTEFQRVSIGEPLPDSLFVFAPPEGATRVPPEEEAPGSPLEGEAAMNFDLERLDGARMSLESLRGKVVLVNFWATWCGPCRVEMPMLQSLYEAHQDKGLEVVAVSIGETREEVAPYIEARAFTFPILLDFDSEIGNLYLAYSIPMSVIVDRDGTVVRHFYGIRTEDWLLQALQEAGL